MPPRGMSPCSLEGRTDRHHAVAEKEVGFGKPKVAFFKCALSSICKHELWMSSHPTHLPTLWLEKYTSDAKLALLTGVPLTGCQKYVVVAWVTADLLKMLCSSHALSVRAVKPLPSAGLLCPAAGCQPDLAESPRPQMIH